MDAGRSLRSAAVGLGWLAAAAAVVPVVTAFRGDFKIAAPGRALHGRLLPVAGAHERPVIRLDTATALVLVYGAQCSACRGNTDNWLRLSADLRAEHPGLPVVVVRGRPDTAHALQVPPGLLAALPEYRLDSGVVETVLGAEQVPATLLVTRGRVIRMVYGTVGPRRQARLRTHLEEATR